MAPVYIGFDTLPTLLQINEILEILVKQNKL